MASVSTNKSGNRRVVFNNAANRRRIIYLGKVPLRAARDFAGKVQAIVICQRLGQQLPREIVEWIVDLPSSTRDKLAAHGLASAASGGPKTLGSLLITYFESLTVKPSTMTTYKQTEQDLLTYFGGDKLIADMTPLDAEQWRQAIQKGRANSTTARRVKTARRIFARAVRWKLITESPFIDVKGGSESNPKRMFFITEDVARKVMDACPDAEWRAIFALSRWGGLRCPSEHLSLRWADVNWETNRLTIPMGKTAERVIPLFPQLRAALMDAFDQSATGAEYVITRYRNQTQNLRTQLFRIIRRAELTRWPKLFHNLRATRQTELAEKYPIQVVCSWIGNSVAVAKKHYLQITDQHFEAAIMDTNQRDAQYDAATSGHARSGAATNRDGAIENAVPSGQPRFGVTPTGLRRVPKVRGKQGRPDEYDAQRDALPTHERMEAVQRAINGYLSPAPTTPEVPR